MGWFGCERKKKNRREERNVRVMIVSLLAEKEGRVMDIWTNVLVGLATPLWAVCLIIIMFSYVI
jgi:hypothetical protein